MNENIITRLDEIRMLHANPTGLNRATILHHVECLLAHIALQNTPPAQSSGQSLSAYDQAVEFLAEYDEIRLDEGVYTLTDHDKSVINNFLIECEAISISATQPPAPQASAQPAGELSDLKKLQIMAGCAIDDMERLHAEFGFPDDQPFDVDDMIEAIQELQAAANIAATMPSAAPAAQESGELATVHAFLLGAGPLDGYHFGQEHPDYIGPNWWRPHLRAAIAKESGELAKLREAPKGALLEAIERAARELPDGYSIEIEVECGFAGVRWSGPDCEWHNIDGEGYLSDDVTEAIDAVIARALPQSMGKGEGNG